VPPKREEVPVVRPVFGKKPNERCAKCGYKFTNGNQWMLDGRGQRVCKARFACDREAARVEPAGELFKGEA
jgi:hypothetical protein